MNYKEKYNILKKYTNKYKTETYENTKLVIYDELTRI